MYHTIAFNESMTLDVEISPKHFLEQVSVEAGTQLQAEIKPYVVELEDGFVEVADLFFDDGTITRRVPFASFSFVE
jgi:hypothetical protein